MSLNGGRWCGIDKRACLRTRYIRCCCCPRALSWDTIVVKTVESWRSMSVRRKVGERGVRSGVDWGVVERMDVRREGGRKSDIAGMGRGRRHTHYICHIPFCLSLHREWQQSSTQNVSSPHLMNLMILGSTWNYPSFCSLERIRRFGRQRSPLLR